MEQRPNNQVEINEFRRRAMIGGTLKSLSERGVSGTTIRSICGGASGSRGLIAHYYASKDELLAAAFHELLSEIKGHVFRAIGKVGDDAVERLKELPRETFSRRVFTEINSGAFLALWHEMRFNPLVRKADRDFYQDYLIQTKGLFAEAGKQVGVTIDVDKAAPGLIAMIDGLWLELSIDAKTASKKQAIELCCEFIDQQLKK